MSVPSKIVRIVWGLVLIGLGISLLITGGQNALLVACVIAIGLFVDGIQGIIYYFTMARFMVKGWLILVRGIIRLALGFAFLFVFDSSSTYLLALIVLMAWFAFSGVQDILMGLERKAEGIKNWWFLVASGALTFVFAIYCLLAMDSNEVMVLIFGTYMIIKGYHSIRRTMHRTAPLAIEDE